MGENKFEYGLQDMNEMTVTLTLEDDSELLDDELLHDEFLNEED